MNDSLYIAATGMQMQQMNVDTIANNLANINTPGFKKGRINFQDLVYRELGRSVSSEEIQRHFFVIQVIYQWRPEKNGCAT